MIPVQDDALDEFVTNRCAKHLARTNQQPRHLVHSGLPGADPHYTQYSEAWRFPFIDAVRSGTGAPASQDHNRVTFVLPVQGDPGRVEVAGSFGALHRPAPLRRITNTPYFAASFLIPTRQVHFYKFRVDEQWLLDPVNPQQMRKESGAVWSRFFTERCTTPLSLERWERTILRRIAAHILPFRTQDGDDFIRRYPDLPEGYRLDKTVGSVNYIDKILAREESHHLIDYRICLTLIDEVLRSRNPYVEPAQMSKEMYAQLYAEMGDSAAGVPGWDKSRYADAHYFLKLLRRHVLTGAFSHPRHGGNAGAIGWLWLEDRYQENGKTLFDWRRTQEAPYGANPSYAG